ncbi:UPF0488 protein CG14286 [Hylaeus volcanicus]|uniref:UPF0488 protein CG14286 n=1 Tax=Hylaeus volcanicus TaxID=313075 RepID=UPI0023B875EF|nr:UPF0488 protein CG14286 [Hylaeus volcanicus]
MPPKPKTNVKKGISRNKNTEPPNAVNPSCSNAETASGLSQEAEDQFELELCWCIQQLQVYLATGKLSEKQARDLTKNVSVLRSSTAPLIKKRQIMRTTLGNYREKMLLDEQKHSKSASSMKFIPGPTQNKKCVFVRKAACKLPSEKQHSHIDTVLFNSNSSVTSVDMDNAQTVFKFNFQLAE